MRLLAVLALVACGTDKAAPDGAGTQDSGKSPAACPTTFSYRTQHAPDQVFVAGSFNDWERDDLPLKEVLDGVWALTVDLPPGSYPYKFVEYTQWSHGGAELMACDPENPMIHCEEGTATDLEWMQDCAAGSDSCNSLRVVEDCSLPRLEVDTVQADRSTGSIEMKLRFVRSHTGAEPTRVSAEINGDQIDASRQSADMFHVELDGLDAGRHTIRLHSIDGRDQVSPPLTVPIWLDDWSWDQAVIYHAMIDRFANSATPDDVVEGTTHPITDYAGGDLAGLQAALPYLEDLGANTLWLSNPQAGPAGAWAGDCGATYAGYHGFWPADWDRIDPHLGDEDALKSLIDAAHARNMRVIIDWVGNHVHQDHPVLAGWPEEATHELAVCSEAGPDGSLNWDRIPESCWFAPYLPDLDQTDQDVLQTTIDKAIEWAELYELDGLRVDAAKHMPHSVSWNLSSQVSRRLEHPGSGFDFLLMGETFDGAEAINAFIGEEQLDGQFDFPLYWQLRDAFIHDSASLRDVVMTASATADRYPGGRMSTFLGNLDVGRFVTTASEGTDDVCPEGSLRQAAAPLEDGPYDRLVMAWTFLFTQPGIPLIYYGDEIGLPGYTDPDNRQPLFWVADVRSGDTDEVARDLAAGPARVLRAVKALASARQDHPALATGETTEWWGSPVDHPSLYAYSRTHGDDAALVVLSRDSEEATLSNSLAFAGLPTDALYEDALSGETFQAEGDSLTLTMAPMSARLLLPRPEEAH